ncbi:MAG: PhoX family phosphatase [Pseudomonadota bacterium]
MNEHYDQIRGRYLKRRAFLRYTAGAAAAVAIAPGQAIASSYPRPSFKPLANGRSASHVLADGYQAQILLAWGDGLDGSRTTALPPGAEAQKNLFGYNNDFLAYTPLSGSERGLLGINHEYSLPHLMFPGYSGDQASLNGLSDDEVACEMASLGHSIVEVQREKDGWRVVRNSPYARRIHAGTSIHIDGPAAGHSLMQTREDPSGLQALGTIGCCSGGKTPWGTVLIAEENVGDFFRGAWLEDVIPNDLAVKDPDWVYLRWGQVDKRFDLAQEPNELNRFGWIVEYNPRKPDQAPVKRTALGRFEHESATVVAVPGHPVVVYSGDDAESQYLYRFVSQGIYEGPQKPAAGLLSKGTLYCAKFNDDGTGRWLALRHGDGPLSAANDFPDQATVLIHARRAATLLGATPMDRPEGIAISPAGSVYVALTKNRSKTAANAANPRPRNTAGHILEILPPEQNGASAHWDAQFGWDILLQGGPQDLAGENEGDYGPAMAAESWLSNPDNLSFDPQGRLWIASDGMDSFGFSDGLWCTPTDGPGRAAPALFFRCPRGAELCSPEFTPDGETMFASIQHPAQERGSTFAKPSTRWPDFDVALPPRPAILAITRAGGGAVGG